MLLAFLLGVCLLLTYALSSSTVTKCSASLLRISASEPKLGHVAQWLWVVVNIGLLFLVDWFIVGLSSDRAKERGISLHR